MILRNALTFFNQTVYSLFFLVLIQPMILGGFIVEEFAT
jgi:hypothetical protein